MKMQNKQQYILPKEFDWTKEDEETVNKIYVETQGHLKWFLIGLVCGVGILILLKLIDWWGIFNLTGVFVR